MKIYAWSMSVLLLIVIAVAGFVLFQQNDRLRAQEESLKQERNVKADAEQRLRDLEDGVKAIRITSEAIIAVADAPIIGGDSRIDRIDDAAATNARQKIGDITDQKDREQALQNWDALRSAGLVRDYQSAMRTLSQNLTRNLEPKK